MAHAVHFLAMDGVLYRGTIKVNALELNSFAHDADGFIHQSRNKRADINTYAKVEIHTNRVPKIDRVCDIAVCDFAKSYVVLQENSKQYLKLPELSNEVISLRNLLDETSEVDSLHDIVFHVQDELFPAHKYIVFSRAEGLRDIVLKHNNDKHIYLQYKYLTARMFMCIMKYIYTNYTLTIADVEVIEASFGGRSGLSNIEIYSRFRELLGLFGVSPLFDRMMLASDTPKTPIAFDRHSYPDLHDITIQCAENKVIAAHRCILSSRLDYFNMMLNNSWSESTNNVIKLDTVPAEYMTPIIDFLYNNDGAVVRRQQYRNSFLYHLAEVCDRFIVTQLKELCEILLIEKMHARNCVDMLDFALTFNCEVLEACALQFICQNMGRLLENYCLTTMQEDCWHKVATRYSLMFDPTPPNHSMYDESFICGQHRMEQLSENQIVDIVGDFKVDLTAPYGTPSAKMPKQKRSERPVNERRSYEKEALNAARRISFEKPSTSTTPRKQDESVISEAIQIAQNHSSEAVVWMKVADKKEVKKKCVLAGLKLNEVLRNEPREKEQFTPLKAVNAQMEPVDRTSDAHKLHATGDEEPTDASIHNLSLSDFTPQKSKKMSQKERRRQLSQSDASPAIDVIAHSPKSTKSVWGLSPATPEQPTNPWKKQTSTDSGSAQPQLVESPISRTPRECNEPKSLNDSFFATTPGMKEPMASTSRSHDSFMGIVEDERKQKEYYIKMKNKPLHLTQMEEKAIAELKAFYNVDNVCDEHIVIERKSNVTPNVNFAKWAQQ